MAEGLAVGVGAAAVGCATGVGVGAGVAIGAGLAVDSAVTFASRSAIFCSCSSFAAMAFSNSLFAFTTW